MLSIDLLRFVFGRCRQYVEGTEHLSYTLLIVALQVSKTFNEVKAKVATNLSLNPHEALHIHDVKL